MIAVMETLKFLEHADWSDPVNWIPPIVVGYILIYLVGIFFGEQ